MRQKAPPFYLVWAEDGGEPRHKHANITGAENEAERLARQNPGRSFCVMIPAVRFTHRVVTVEKFDGLDSEIPF